MSKGLGRIELLVLGELKQGDALTINDLSIAVVGLKSIGVLELPCNSSEWQSAARAVRSLIKKGLVVQCGIDGAKKVYKSN